MPAKSKEKKPAEKANEEFKFSELYVVHFPALDKTETYAVHSNKPLEGGLEGALRDPECKVTCETGELEGMPREVLADKVANGEVEVAEKKPFGEALEKATGKMPQKSYQNAFKEVTGKMSPKEAKEIATTTQQYKDPATGTRYLVQFHKDKVPNPSTMAPAQLFRPGNIARVYVLEKGQAEGIAMAASDFIKLVKGDERSGTPPKMLKKI